MHFTFLNELVILISYNIRNHLRWVNVKYKNKFSIKDFFVITFGVFLVAVSVYYLMIPADFATGSLSGFVMILSNFIPLPVSIMLFTLNTILLILGFLLVGKEFGIKTVYASTMLPVFIWLFEHISPNIKPFTENIVLSAICVILVSSAGLAMLFYTSASSGGLDIVAMILSKYTAVNIGKAMSIIGGMIALSGFPVYGIEKGVTGLLTTLFMGYGIDIFISGFNLKKHVNIIVMDPNPLKNYITDSLGRGCTIRTVKGGYSGIEQYEISTILSKNECSELIDHMKSSDERAFVSIANATDIYGTWNEKKRVNFFEKKK